MNLKTTEKAGSYYIAMTISIVALAVFLFQTKMLFNPLITMAIALFLLMPFRRETQFVKRVMVMISLLFVGWLFSFLGYALLPFIIAFMIAYLLDPFVSFLEKKKFPRWLAALLVVLLMIGIGATIAILVFPLIFSQLNDAIRKISALLNDTSKYLESKKFYNTLAKMGVPRETMKSLVQHEIIPKIDGIFNIILYAMMSMLSRVSTLGTQIINVILVPIMTFYFLKDFDKLKKTIEKILGKKNAKLLRDIKRINRMFKVYFSWQIIAAFMIGTTCSVLFSLFGVPYPIVLGVLCGFLNPIPFLGTLMSMGICFVTILIVSPANFWEIILIITLVINGMHILNAYILEPNIVGKQVGLHPIVLIASLFVFGGLFGLLGLLVAVPCTGAIMMFFDDWVKKNVDEEPLVDIVGPNP